MDPVARDRPAGDLRPAGRDQRRTVVLPASAGGLTQVQQDQVRAGGGPTLDRMRRAGLRNPVLGRYAAPGNPEPVLSVYGAQLDPPLKDSDVAGSAPRELDEAFQRLTIAGVVSYDGTSRTFDAGPLGGQVR